MRGMRYPMPPRPGMGPPRYRGPYPPPPRGSMPFSAPQSPVMPHRFSDHDDYRVHHNQLHGDYDFSPAPVHPSDFTPDHFPDPSGSPPSMTPAMSASTTMTTTTVTSASASVASAVSNETSTTSNRDNERQNSIDDGGCDDDSCDAATRDNPDATSDRRDVLDFNDEHLDEERELPKTFTKARPFSEQRENKFTSTLRRLSTVR